MIRVMGKDPLAKLKTLANTKLLRDRRQRGGPPLSRMWNATPPVPRTLVTFWDRTLWLIFVALTAGHGEALLF